MHNFKLLVKRLLKHKAVINTTALLVLFTPGMLLAQVALPAVNLGSTSFEDGYAGPGTLIDFTIDHFNADEIMSSTGDTLVDDVDIKTNAGLLLLAHFTEKKIFGAYYGFEMLIPVVDLDIDVFGRNTASGIGDIAISPVLLQWTDHKLFGFPIAHRFNLAFAIPTGDYDTQDPLNIGSNAFRFNPHYAITIEFSKKLEASFRAHYLWNSRNDSFREDGGVQQTSQAGEAFHLNFAASYQISENFRIGANGYYLKQISSHEINSESIEGKEQVLGFGPGVQARYGSYRFILNAYFESQVESRAKGHRLAFKIAKVF